MGQLQAVLIQKGEPKRRLPRWLLTVFVQVLPLLSVSVSGSQLSPLETIVSTWRKLSVWGVFTAWPDLGS